MNELWIARNLDGTLNVFISKPYKSIDFFKPRLYEQPLKLHRKFFPEVTWENSPQKLTVVIDKN